MSPDHIPKVALRWTLTGKGSKGRPKTTWRRSIIAELSDMGLTMGEAEVIARDRQRGEMTFWLYVPHGDCKCLVFGFLVYLSIVIIYNA